MVNSTVEFKKDLSAPKKILIIIIILGCALTFTYYWYRRAYHRDTTFHRDVQTQDGITTFNYTTTWIMTNYFPFHYSEFEPIIYNVTYYFDGSKHVQLVKEIEHYEIRDYDFEIHSVSFEVNYEGKPLVQPDTQKDLSSFPHIQTLGMSNTTVILNWSLSIPEPTNGTTNFYLVYRDTATEDSILGYMFKPFYYLGSVFFLYPYLIFAVSGFVFSWAVFRKIGIEKAYGQLKGFSSKVKGKDTVEINKNLTTSIKAIINFPTELHSLTRLFFGLSIFILKLITNRICKEHNKKIDEYRNIYPYKRKKLKKIFAKVKEQAYDEIKDFFPEFSTIAIIIGFLAAVGISFQWNVGAAEPFLYSVFVFYLFMNLGSSFYFLKKTKDRIYPIGIFIVALIVVNFTLIVDFLRAFPYMF